MKHLKKYNESINEMKGTTPIPSDKGPMISRAIEESLRDGDLNRLKTIYKGLPEDDETKDGNVINKKECLDMLVQWMKK